MASSWICSSPEDTRQLGECLALHSAKETWWALEGDLGAGKTTFVQGVARGLGITQNISSPTFSLLNVYRGRKSLFHLDAYRCQSPAEWDTLMIEEQLESPFLVVLEWAKVFWDALPETPTLFRFLPGPDPESRKIVRMPTGSAPTMMP